MAQPAESGARALTGNVVYNHFGHACRYRVRMDLLGDRSERSEFGPTGRYLMERGNRHERDVFAKIHADHPGEVEEIGPDESAEDREADLQRRTAATLEAMRRGAKFILHGFLTSEPGDLDLDIVGRPAQPSALVARGETDLLVRVEEPSPEFGDWSYVVGDVKSSRHARFPQKMQVTFYSWLLSKRQGVLPTRGFIVTGEGRRESFEIDETIWALRLFLEEEVHECLEDPSVFYHVEKPCGHCHWREHCAQRAANSDDLSLIPGMRRADKRALLNADIKTRADLLKTPDEALRRLGRSYGSRLDGFRDLKRRASAQEFKTPLLRQHPLLQNAADKARAGSPDLFRHRGPLLVVAAVPDHYHGGEAAIATQLLRNGPKGLESLTPMRFANDPIGDGHAVFAALLREVAEVEKLCAARRELVLPIFSSGRTVWNLRRRASMTRHAAAITGVERLASDSLILSDLVDRTFFLPVRIEGTDELATALEKKAKQNKPTRERLFDIESLAAFHLRSGKEEDEEAARARAEKALSALRATAAEFDLEFESIEKEGDDIRTLLVREWRRSGEEHWLSLIEFELQEEAKAATFVIEALLGTARERGDHPPQESGARA